MIKIGDKGEFRILDISSHSSHFERKGKFINNIIDGIISEQCDYIEDYHGIDGKISGYWFFCCSAKLERVNQMEKARDKAKEHENNMKKAKELRELVDKHKFLLK